MVMHFAYTNRAICGANQGRRMFARVRVTANDAKVTCRKCIAVRHGARDARYASNLPTASSNDPEVR